MKRPLLICAMLLAITACDREPATPGGTQASATAPEPRLEGQLDVLAWPGYVVRGKADVARDWVARFEAATSCKVNVRTAASSDEMVTLMDQGDLDVVIASGDASQRLVADGKVQAIDIARLKSYARVDERLRDAPWHTIDGVHYGVPFQWGPNLLMYDTSVFMTAPSSWSIVFEEQALPDGKSNRGRIQAFDSPIQLADAALYLMHARPKLGIRDPYQLNARQYAAALALLRKQKDLVHRYWRDPAVQVGDFKNEGVVAAVSWPSQVQAAQAAGLPVAWVVPQEGATGWADSMMLHVAAKHPNCAYKWMDWALDPEVQGDIAASFGSVPAVPSACAKNARLGLEGCARNGAAEFDRLHFWRMPGMDCPQGECVPYSRWTEDFLSLVDD